MPLTNYKHLCFNFKRLCLSAQWLNCFLFQLKMWNSDSSLYLIICNNVFVINIIFMCMCSHLQVNLLITVCIVVYGKDQWTLRVRWIFVLVRVYLNVINIFNALCCILKLVVYILNRECFLWVWVWMSKLANVQVDIFPPVAICYTACKQTVYCVWKSRY